MSTLSLDDKEAPLPKKKIGTHNLGFHADEVLACVMLKMLPEYRDAEIIRTRDQAVLKECDIVVDVGGEYDHQRHRYDHHQPEFNMTMREISEDMIKSDVRLSSAGLIYWHFGKEVLQEILDPEPERLEYIFCGTYYAIIKEVDDMDNHGGARYPSRTKISSLVSMMKPEWDDEEQDVDRSFHEAMVFVKEWFIRFVKRQDAQWRGWLALENLVAEDSSVIDRHRNALNLRDSRIPWKVNIWKVERNLKLDIHQVIKLRSENQDWTVKVWDNQYPNVRFPKEWAGLRDDDLEEVTGVKGAKFVHRNCHFGVAKTPEAINELIDKSKKMAKENRMSLSSGFSKMTIEGGGDRGTRALQERNVFLQDFRRNVKEHGGISGNWRLR